MPVNKMGKKTDKSNSESNRPNDEAIDRLVAKRNQCERQFQKFSEFFEKLNKDDEQAIIQLRMRTDKIEQLLEEVNEIDLEIELLDKNFVVDLTFEDRFYDVVAQAKECLNQLNNKVKQQHSPDNFYQNQNMFQSVPFLSGNMAQGGAKLPNLGLPQFDGDYGKWMQFKETFGTLISKNQFLDDIQRFYYLLDSLQGDARKIVESLEITADNYRIAWELLESRFNNRPVIVHSHIKAIFDAPTLTVESFISMRNLVDNLERNLRSLKSLGEPVEYWDKLLIYVCSKQLDRTTKKQWEEKTIDQYGGNPTLQQFTEFILNRARILENLEINAKPLKLGNKAETKFDSKFQDSRTKKGEHFNRFSHGITNASHDKISCEMCKGNHFLYHCEKFLELEVNARIERVKRLRLCLNCLRKNHIYSECLSRPCRSCGIKHNTLLCKSNNTGGKGRQEQIERPGNEADSENSATFTAASCSHQYATGEVMLSTAVILIESNFGEFIKCRALLDSASQISFIRKDLVEKLGLRPENVIAPIVGVGEKETKSKQRVFSRIKSLHNGFDAYLSLLVLETITGQIPIRSFNRNVIKLPDNIVLADPHFNQTSQIDLLIGAELFFEILCVGQIRVGPRLILQKSVFGWLLSGKIPESKYQLPNAVCNIAMDSNKYSDIQTQLERFWTIEEVSGANNCKYSLEEQSCEEFFTATTYRDESGRFIVSLPFKENITQLGDSFNGAQERFFRLERQLKRNSGLQEKYHKFLAEYIQLGHMTRVENLDYNKSELCYFLPHHGVLNENSITTKLRVVFDASAKSSTGISLNDCLKVGPVVQEELFDILVRFRQHNIVITADIEKMYRQVNVSETNRKVQRILWRFNNEMEVQQFTLNTLTELQLQVFWLRGVLNKYRSI